jgi:hypothetical protein
MTKTSENVNLPRETYVRNLPGVNIYNFSGFQGCYMTTKRIYYENCASIDKTCTLPLT